MKNKNVKSEKCSVVNSNVEGGFTKNRKKAFTLIELLAIIVILAIIAVITVPIILNIIENSRKGAATDSAYGYKDSVNKWYVSELSNPNNQNFNLSSSYTVENGKIIDDSVQNDTGVLIPFSGDKPSSGELHYSNNVFKGGCLVFGDYAVTFETDGTTSTVKGDCSDYSFDDNEYAYAVEVITDASDGSSTRPTDSVYYLKYTLTNGTIAPDTTPEVCIYSENFSEKELCLKYGDSENIPKIKDYFGYTTTGDNAWVQSPNFSIIWTNPSNQTIGCNNDNEEYFVCYDGVVTAGAYSSGGVFAGDNWAETQCSIYDNVVSCS